MKNLKLRILTLFVLSVFIFNSCSAQEVGQKIHWMSFEEAFRKNEKEPRKIFIDVYTHWCGWCKRMDASTFQDNAIAKYMNDKFYTVKFDAETKDSIRFKDKVFTFRPEYKANELAVSLLNGQMGYPAFIFLDEQFNMLGPLSGYQTTEQLTPVLSYFGENIYKNKKWEDYVKDVNGN